MSIIPLLALPAGLEMTAFSRQQGTLCVSVLSTQSCSHCPLCGAAATRIHSRDPRRLADLPSAGQPVRFLLTVRKFFCDMPTCPRKIFAERLASFIAPWARVTTRLFQMVQIIGLATGGRLGVRVTDRMGIQTSRTTILRRIMALPTEPVGQVTHIGIDDFCATRSYMSSCKDSRKEDLTWSSASSAEPSLNQERLGQGSRTRKGGLASVRK